MKANNGSGNCKERDIWETPNWLFNILFKQYIFTFDCCADENNAKVFNYSKDFLNTKLSVKEICWMNPPFSKAKEMFEHFFKITKKGVAIYRCDNPETKIWQNIIFPNADWIFFLKGRVNYYLATENACGRKGSRFPSALIGKGVPVPKGIEGHVVNTRDLQSSVKVLKTK